MGFWILQVIPSFLDQPDKDNENKAHVFAYISVEDMKAQEKEVKTLRGQIRKCNLTESRMAGGVVLGEVRLLTTLFSINL